MFELLENISKYPVCKKDKDGVIRCDGPIDFRQIMRDIDREDDELDRAYDIVYNKIIPGLNSAIARSKILDE